MEEGTDLQQSGQSKLGRRGWAIGIKGLHVDDEGGLCGAFTLHKSLSIRETRVDGHQASPEQGIQHCLHQGAVGWFLVGGVGIS